MTTLHIEHAITDFGTWKSAFDRFAPQRAEGRVVAHRVLQPHDDAGWVVVQLDFSSVEQALSFREFLQARVWSVPANSPGLAGSPLARILIDPPQL